MENGNLRKSPSRKPGKASQSPPLLPKLDQSLVVVRDLKEQPSSPFILLTGAGKPVYYAVDDMKVDAGTAIFYLKGKMVYTCRLEGTWALVHRDVVRVTDDRTLTEFQMEDAKVTEEFYEKLDPKGWADSKRVAMASLGLPVEHEHAHKPVPGQYL